MHAVHTGCIFLFQRLCRRNVGKDHEFFDQLVGIVPFTVSHAGHVAVFIDDDFAFGKVKVQRAALNACFVQNVIGFIERINHAFHERIGQIGWLTVLRRLHLIVRQTRFGAHDAAHDLKAPQSARCVDTHVKGHTGTVFFWA